MSDKPFKPLPWWLDIGTTIFESVAYTLGLLRIITSAAMIEAQSELNTIAANFKHVPLGPATLAEMVIRKIIPEDWAAGEAAKSSIPQDDFEKMVLVTGEPPGLMQMLNLWRRGLLDKHELERMVAYSRVRTEWTKYIELLAHDTMSQAEALEAAVKGVIPPAEAKDLFIKAGGLAEQFQPLLDTSGNAIGVQQVEMLWLHGLATSEDVRKVIVHSRINPMFEPLAAKLYHHYLSAFQVKLIVGSGGATPEQGTKWLTEQGYPPDQAAALTGAAHHGAAAKVHDITEAQTLELFEAKFITEAEAKTILTHLGYPVQVQHYLLEIIDARRALSAITQAVGYTRKAYLAGRIDDNQAQTELGELQVPVPAVHAYLAAWRVERKSQFRTLTEAQVGAAVKKNYITHDDALSRWAAMGYDPVDSAIFLAEHGGPPPPGSPAAQGKK